MKNIVNSGSALERLKKLIPPGMQTAPALDSSPKNAESPSGMNVEKLNQPVSETNLVATQIKPVADLYGITSPTGSETTFTFDAGEASGFVGSGWSVQEFVELERYQAACAGNSPVTQGGWKLVPTTATPSMVKAGGAAARKYMEETGGNSPFVIYEAMVAAAPQREEK